MKKSGDGERTELASHTGLGHAPPMGALASAPTAARLSGPVGPVGEALRGPASGLPCVHWRLRIHEQVAPGLELVHELVSPEPVEIAWSRDPAEPPVPVRLQPDHARLHATPTLFRPGSPGARAVADLFGLRGIVRVEEVLIRPGELVAVEGHLCDPSAALSTGPFRTIDAPLELMHATVHVETGISLRPVILPWALSVAAILGTAGAATAAIHWWGAHGRGPALPGGAPEIVPDPVPHPHWP
jgi:hypothetical protein